MEAPGGGAQAAEGAVWAKRLEKGAVEVHLSARGGAAAGRGLFSGRRLASKSQEGPPPPGLVPDGGGGGGLSAPVRRLPGGGGMPGVYIAAGEVSRGKYSVILLT